MRLRLRRFAPAFTLSLTLLGGAALAPPAVAIPTEAVASGATELDLPDPATVRLARAAVAGHRSSSEIAAAAPIAPWVRRIAGSDRYATAAAVSKEWTYVWEGGNPNLEGLPRIVVVASGERFPDALSGGALAGNLFAPVLLTRQASLPTSTTSALRELRPDLVVLLGGTAAVGAPVEKALHSFVPSPDDVVRIDGKDRYEVSATIAALIGGDSRRVYVASGQTWADGLAGGAVAGTTFAPLLLTRKDGVPAPVMEVLGALAPAEITLVGGTGSVSAAVLDQLSEVAPVTRVAGADRYATAARLAATLPPSHEATMASGLAFPDALAGSAFATMSGGSVLLLHPTGVPTATLDAVLTLRVVMITALGGGQSVPEPVLDQLRELRV